jgi:hypothetical protein
MQGIDRQHSFAAREKEQGIMKKDAQGDIGSYGA